MNVLFRLRDWFLKWLGPGGFSGVTLGDWWKLLRENRFSIDPPYWGRAASITMAGIGNSIGRRVELIRFGKAIQATSVEAPLFVLGSWRSGTTHLHNLLSQDARFAWANTYQVINPHIFLTYERFQAPFQSLFFTATRPQDNVAFGIYEPQEDEFALLSLCGLSMMAGWAFPRHRQHYDQFMTFEQATSGEVEQWKQSLLFFLKKLSFKFGKPLVLKSPAHTARIQLLLEMFPQAKFVMIHRHPYQIHSSTLHTMEKVTPLWSLQRWQDVEVVDHSIQLYKTLLDAYLDQRALVPSGHLTEVAFDELEQSPIETLRRVYADLRLPDFAATESKITDYVESLAGYRKNKFAEIPAEQKQKLVHHWQRSFAEWGYEP